MTLPVVHPNAAVGAGATLDAGVQVGYPAGRAIAERLLLVGPGATLRSGTVLYEGSRIGGGLQTGHNVVIREENVLGVGVQVWSNSVIDYGCVIGDRVKIHSNCYVAQFTTIGDDCFLAPGVTIANDIHPGCAFSQPCMQGPTLEAGVQVGVNATLLPFIRIGAGAIIAAGAVVTANVPAGSVVAGNPARVVRQREELVCSTGLTDRPYPAQAPHGTSASASEDTANRMGGEVQAAAGTVGVVPAHVEVPTQPGGSTVAVLAATDGPAAFDGGAGPDRVADSDGSQRACFEQPAPSGNGSGHAGNTEAADARPRG